jgi:phage terminase large subunit-like protein
MARKKGNINQHVERWLTMVESEEIMACADQRQLCALVRRCFATEDISTDGERLEKYLGLVKYFTWSEVFPWEAFCVALHLCTFWQETGLPRWPDMFLLVGRGAGKDGLIALESLCVTSPYSDLPMYDVDICANSEEQAKRPVQDIVFALDSQAGKMKRFYKWGRERVTGLKYRGTIKGRTSNPKSKDGMRSGMVVFNEIHQYESYANIKAFVSGQGKTMHPRRLYATTNGDVREGPLDELLAQAEMILRGEAPDGGLLPFICRVDTKEDADREECWEKANPSLPRLPSLRLTMQKEYQEWKANPVASADFMTKRMNLPQSEAESAVTDWENIKATNRPLPDLSGRECICGIDYASVSDFTSVNFHFRNGEERYDINHSWLCLRSKDLFRLKIPWREWAQAGHLTVVDDVEIPPELICSYVLEHAEKYQIRQVAIDNFRFALFASSLQKIGFTKDGGNVRMIKPTDIMKAHPVIASAFNNHLFTWGDCPPLRWAANNTKLVRSSRIQGSDTGNFYYAKIEAKSRKTDPFMALVYSMICEDELGEGSSYGELPMIKL